MPTSQVFKQFRARPGSRITDAQAQIYGERLETLAEEHNGGYAAADVVEDAKDVKAPYHDYFEWNNKMAGHEWRLQQARVLTGSITVVVVRKDGSEDEHRAIEHVVREFPSPETGETQAVAEYVPLKTIVSEPTLWKQLLARYLHEVKQWRKRASLIKELGETLEPIFAAIDTVEASLK